jgi:hypothetical protein
LAVSRRKFLHNGVLAAAACATRPLLAFSSPRRPVGDNQASGLPTLPHSSGADDWKVHAAALDHINRNHFSGAVGEAFKVTVPNAQPVWVTLLAVEDLPPPAVPNPASFAVRNKNAAAGLGTSGFTLRFGSSSSLPQGTYLFQHSKLGSFALFTVPDSDGQSYTAVINRLDAVTVAVPYSQPATQSNSAAPGSGITAAPATSSGTGSLLPSRVESPGVQRVLMRD